MTDGPRAAEYSTEWRGTRGFMVFRSDAPEVQRLFPAVDEAWTD